MDPVTEVDALLRGHVSDARDRLDDAMEGTRERLEAQVQGHPVRTLLVALGAGMLLGLLLGKTRKRRSQ